MDANAAELFRRLQNLIRIGTIADVDGIHVRVHIGNNTTQWRPWINTRAGNARTWWQPSIGEQCLFFSPDGEMTEGIALVGIYSDQHPAPSQNPALHVTHYPDNAVIQYDFESHALTATLPNGSSAVITADSVTSNAPTTTCTGDLIVDGHLTVAGKSALNGGASVKPGSSGGTTVEVDGDVVANGISLTSHTHSGVTSGGSSTGGPQ